MFVRLTMAAVLAASVTSVALAQGRPDARQMSCQQVQSMLDHRGAAVMTTGRYTYDRFVGRGGACSYPEVPTATRVTTRDTNGCIVYNCQRDPFEDWRRDRW